MFYPLLLTQNVHVSIVFLSVKLIIIKIEEWDHFSLTQISQAKLGQIVHVRGVLNISGPADFKSLSGLEN